MGGRGRWVRKAGYQKERRQLPPPNGFLPGWGSTENPGVSPGGGTAGGASTAGWGAGRGKRPHWTTDTDMRPTGAGWGCPQWGRDRPSPLFPPCLGIRPQGGPRRLKKKAGSAVSGMCALGDLAPSLLAEAAPTASPSVNKDMLRLGLPALPWRSGHSLLGLLFRRWGWWEGCGGAPGGHSQGGSAPAVSQAMEGEACAGGREVPD